MANYNKKLIMSYDEFESVDKQLFILSNAEHTTHTLCLKKDITSLFSKEHIEMLIKENLLFVTNTVECKVVDVDDNNVALDNMLNVAFINYCSSQTFCKGCKYSKVFSGGCKDMFKKELLKVYAESANKKHINTFVIKDVESGGSNEES